MDVTLFNWNPSKSRTFIILSLILVVIIYYLLHTRYILYNGDDTWRMTRIYNYITTGLNQDTIFRTIETEDKTILFSILYHTIFGHFFELFGWTKSNAYLLNTFIIFLAAGQWYFILQKLQFSKQLSIIFPLTMLLFPAYFGAANLTRLDAFVFFWATSAFHLFIKQRYFFAGLALMIGMETHPMGMIGGFYILAFVLANWQDFFKDWQKLIKIGLGFLAGVGLGVLYYCYLHQDVLTWERFSNIVLNNRNIKKEFPNYILTNFVNPEWYLHVWELFILIIPPIIYLKNQLFTKNKFVWIFYLVLIFSTFITGRPNRHYFVFLFPAFHLLFLYTAEQVKQLKPLTFVLMGIFVVHYGLIYFMNKSYDFAKITNQISNNLENKNIPVVGMSDNWFAAKEHPFYLIYNSIKDLPEQNLKEFYLIENDYLHTAPISLQLEDYVLKKGWTKDPLISKRKRHYVNTISYFKANYNCQLLNSFKAYGSESAAIYFCSKPIK